MDLHKKGLLSSRRVFRRSNIYFNGGAEYKVFKDDKVRFWHDSWLCGMPLKIQFNNLYDICLDQNVVVQDMWDGNDGVFLFEEVYMVSW